MKRLALLAAALVVYGSLYPWQFDSSRAGGSWPWLLLHSWPGNFDRFVARDVVLNVLLYFPVGMATFLALARLGSRLAATGWAILLSLALSTAIEILQVYVPGRDPSLADVTCNVIGGAVGALAALRFQGTIEERLRYRFGRDAGAVLFLLGLWAVSQWYPFFPALSQHQLRVSLAELAHGPVSPVEVCASAAEWYVAALALRALYGHVRIRWLAAGVLGWAAGRLFVAGRTVTPDEAAGAALALVLWIALRDNVRLRAGAWLLGMAVAARELTPFHFSWQAAPFLWRPFEATLDSERQSAVVLLARKAFDYGASVWLLRRLGTTPARSTLLVTAALLFFEVIQRHIPGRTPEITDPLLALLLGLALWLREAASSSRGASARAEG